MTGTDRFMKTAIEEARQSLREGNHGFGAVIVRGDELIARSHDMEETECDPTSHAETNAIRLASKAIGKDLSGCMLVSTHEPCPMCAAAAVWAGIDSVSYGYSIEESISQGRSRISLTCVELFRRAGKDVIINKNVLHDECSVLYRQDVRSEVQRLRNITDEKLRYYNADSVNRRIEWFNSNRDSFSFIGDDPVRDAYNLLLRRFNIDASEAPAHERSAGRIIFHSMNFCPTLEACKILGYDTRYICKNYNENSTDTLVKQVDSRLRFARNYDCLRPYSVYCEEMIILDDTEESSNK